MSVLVTGATGFVGGHLMREHFHALVRRPSGYRNEIVCDITKQKSLKNKLNGIETIIHCAGISDAMGNLSEKLHWEVNFNGTKNLISEARNSGVKKFIFLSSVKAIPRSDFSKNQDTSYGLAKRAAEEFVLNVGRSFGMHVVVLRPAMVYGLGCKGNLERMVRGIRHGWFPKLPDTENRRSAIYIDDLVTAIWLSANSPAANGKTFTVAHPDAFSTRELYNVIKQNSPRKMVSWSLSEDILSALGQIGDTLERTLKVNLPLNSSVVSRLLGSEYFAPSDLQNQLGWAAETDITQGIQKYMSDLGLNL